MIGFPFVREGHRGKREKRTFPSILAWVLEPRSGGFVEASAVYAEVAALDALAKHLGLLPEVPATDCELKLSIEDMRAPLEMWEVRAS